MAQITKNGLGELVATISDGDRDDLELTFSETGGVELALWQCGGVSVMYLNPEQTDDLIATLQAYKKPR